MPKNIFQRPTNVPHNNKVPRHGSRLPTAKPGGRKNAKSKTYKTNLPSLSDLLGKKAPN
ncbi:hypothetical protein PSQ19_08820 [Devosia algicola]|uniref:Uncharacterized protein n=1 Tax=Devosia algicola TaxID=3026418 RepID=A0ABY7YSZ7_9HYPH|nr:hypothetical protein [Devosia algicola]WDR04089.1 hypothetical protein PSQ19_08820 [Devosia algicola]